MSSTNSPYPWPTATGGLRFAAPIRSDQQPDVELKNITPARRDWLPELLEKLLPSIVEGVQVVASRHDPKLLHEPRTGLVPVILKESYGVDALYGWYAFAAAKFAAQVVETPSEQWPSRQDDHPPSLDTLVKVGTGTDELNSSIDALEPGPLQLIAISQSTPTISLRLDESAWRDRQRPQRKRGLETIALLSKTCSVELVTSPTLQEFLSNRHPDWVDTYLTERNNTPTQQTHTSPSDNATADIESVYARLGEYTPGGGRLRLLGAIPLNEGEYREIRDLKTDSGLDLSNGTIDRYYRDLDADGFLTVDERGTSNSVALTPAGRVARVLMTDEYQIRHPRQSRLGDDLTDPPQQHTSLVSGADPPHPLEGGQSFEESLGVDTGGSGGTNVRQLSPASCWLTEQELVDRLAAGQSADGITLINDRISKFTDGRSTYLGHAEDEVHVIVQWGGPLPTLARLGTALLSTEAFDQILTPPRVNPLLTTRSTIDALRLGRQLGWLSDTERTYDKLRARYVRIGSALLRRLAYREEGPEEWAQICSEAHGLLATATNLYDAAGYDLTIHVRIPDTDQLTRDQNRYEKFIDFLVNTVPKNAAYRGNSAARMLLEEDGEKLGYRLPVDIDTSDRDAELTAKWVVVGPDATDFQDDIVDALGSISIREQVANGTETGIRIPIEVTKANTYPNLYRVVEAVLERLDRDINDDLDIAFIVQLYLAAFSNVSHRSLTCSPFDITEALIAASRVAPADKPISLSDLTRGIGAVSSKKIYPWLPPTAQEMMRVLFASRKPIGRSEILERADLSKSSYERHRGRLDEAGLLAEPETHRYIPEIPGQWDRRNGASASNDGDELHEWKLRIIVLRAQIRAHQVIPARKRANLTTTTYIG